MVRTDLPLSNINQEVLEAIRHMRIRNSDETPEMWCDRIHAPFKKILEENPRFFSKNEYIQMYDWSYIDGKKVTTGPLIHSTNYIYCTVCDSLVYIPDNWTFCLTHSATASNHLKRCIAENTRYSSISAPTEHLKGAGERAKREEFLHVIAQKEYYIWQLKQRMMQYEAEIRRNQLELSPQFQSLSHSEKDKLASVSYDINNINFETYMTSPAQYDYTTVAGSSSAQHDYTNLGTLSAYFKSMQKGMNI